MPALRERGPGQGFQSITSRLLSGLLHEAAREFFSLRRKITKTSGLFAIWAAASFITIASCARSSGQLATGQFIDEFGRSVTLRSQPRRIVSLAPSVTETLFALGLKDRIIGVTSFCDYPPETAAVEKVGDTQRPSIEKIVSLKPDLVVVSTSSELEPFVKRLDDLGIPVYVSNPRNVDEVLRSIDGLGQVTGAVDKARELVNEMRERIERVEYRTSNRPKPAVLLLLGTEPLITAGSTSFLNDLINRAGGRSISGDIASDYPQFSFETAVERKPEVIFIEAGEDTLPARLKDTPAGKSGRVFHLADELLLRPGPRIVDGLEAMAEKIHPILD